MFCAKKCLGSMEKKVVSPTKATFLLFNLLYDEENVRIIDVHAPRKPRERLFQKLCVSIE